MGCFVSSPISCKLDDPYPICQDHPTGMIRIRFGKEEKTFQIEYKDKISDITLRAKVLGFTSYIEANDRIYLYNRRSEILQDDKTVQDCGLRDGDILQIGIGVPIHEEL